MSDVARLDRQFVQAAMSAPYLARDEEQALASRWRDQRDEAALHQLARTHMRLVIAMAKRFRHYGLPIADLAQEGHVGLLEAAARFEPSRDVRFSTYATWWIRASIQDYILRNWSIVRGGTSSGQKSLFFNLRRLRARLTRGGQDRMDASAYDRIARSLGVRRADVAAMDARLSGPDLSLDASIDSTDEGGGARLDMLEDPASLPDETVGARIDAARRADWLRAALAHLSERERRILRERRMSDDAPTLDALGSRLGISKERVRQIEARALEKLRSILLAHHPRAALISA